MHSSAEIPANPPWADDRLSRDMSILRARGEGQALEYIGAFPANLHELAKEIAAFATSGGGMILIGVNDDGALLGLPEAFEGSGRDLLLRRLEGVCKGTVSPAITPQVSFATEEGKVVLVISIPRGSQPVYYSNGKPYIRHLSSSRPAEPHEVIEQVSAYLGARSSTQASTTQPEVELAILACADLVEAGFTVGDRMVNPEFERLRAEARGASDQLRSAAASSTIRDRGLADVLETVALMALRIAEFRPYLGMGDAFQLVVRDAAKAANGAIERLRATSAPDQARQKAAVAVYRQYANELRLLLRAATEGGELMRVQDLQDRVSLLGMQVLQLTYGPLRELHEPLLDDLREHGRRELLTSTLRVALDGGSSHRNVLLRVRSLVEDSQLLVERLEAAFS